MATMIDGESYVGRVLIRPLSQSGDLTLDLAPAVPEEPNGRPHLRHLISREKKFSALMRTDPVGIGTRAAMINSGLVAPTKTSPRAWSRRLLPARLVLGTSPCTRPAAPGGCWPSCGGSGARPCDAARRLS